MAQQREWGPGLLLDARQTPGRGASLTSSMRLRLAIKMQLIGGTTAKNNKMTSSEGTRRQLITLNKEGCAEPQLSSDARRQSPPQGSQGSGRKRDGAQQALPPPAPLRQG